MSAPNWVWVSDITYVWTREGWLYLAVVIDLYVRKVVGWSMGKRLIASLACDALRMALSAGSGATDPSFGPCVQYASRAFRRLLKVYGIEGGRSRKGDCWDNAVVESFYQFGYQQIRYRRREKNRVQVMTLMAMTNLYLQCRVLFA